MKYLYLLAIVLFSCEVPKTEYRFYYVAHLTTLRIDDGEYHFSTDNTVVHDQRNEQVWIERGSAVYPELYIRQERQVGYGDSTWSEVKGSYHAKYKIILPYDYKIETFDD